VGEKIKACGKRRIYQHLKSFKIKKLYNQEPRLGSNTILKLEVFVSKV
jgi:hypothetical protein